MSFLLFNRSSRLKRKEPSPGELIGLFLVGNSQFIPALCPAPLEYQPPAPGFHSGAEPKFAIPLYLAGLISSFHGIYSYI